MHWLLMMLPTIERADEMRWSMECSVRVFVCSPCIENNLRPGRTWRRRREINKRRTTNPCPLPMPTRNSVELLMRRRKLWTDECAAVLVSSVAVKIENNSRWWWLGHFPTYTTGISLQLLPHPGILHFTPGSLFVCVRAIPLLASPLPRARTRGVSVYRRTNLARAEYEDIMNEWMDFPFRREPDRKKCLFMH